MYALVSVLFPLGTLVIFVVFTLATALPDDDEYNEDAGKGSLAKEVLIKCSRRAEYASLSKTSSM